MMGSGTTGKMAIKYDRKFIGIDISQEYVDLAHKRIAAEAAQLKMF
jgi:DNA modification methylase